MPKNNNDYNLTFLKLIDKIKSENKSEAEVDLLIESLRELVKDIKEESDDVYMDFISENKVIINGETCRLTQKEYVLLLRLYVNFNKITHFKSVKNESSLKQQIYRLNRKIPRKFIIKKMSGVSAILTMAD